MEKILILDASAVINGISIDYPIYHFITTPQVMDEVKGKETFFQESDIEQRIPKQEFIDQVKEKVEEAKDNLSEQDIGLLALAHELNAEIVTDDYGIQNIATKLKLKFMPVGEPGIKEVFHWQYYCPACFKKHEHEGTCEVCGTKLKRKVKEKLIK